MSLEVPYTRTKNFSFAASPGVSATLLFDSLQIHWQTQLLLRSSFYDAGPQSQTQVQSRLSLAWAPCTWCALFVGAQAQSQHAFWSAQTGLRGVVGDFVLTLYANANQEKSIFGVSLARLYGQKPNTKRKKHRPWGL